MLEKRMIKNIVDNAEKGGYEREFWGNKTYGRHEGENMTEKIWTLSETKERNEEGTKHFIKFLNNLNADNAIINKFQDNL